MKNLLSQVATMVDGAKNLTLWVGSGAEVVAPEVAQSRADVCLTCPLNQAGSGISREVAEATHKFIEFKNELQLRVKGEDELFHCSGCGCVISLMVWEPGERIRNQMTSAERHVSPAYCWKIKA